MVELLLVIIVGFNGNVEQTSTTTMTFDNMEACHVAQSKIYGALERNNNLPYSYVECFSRGEVGEQICIGDDEACPS